MVPASMKKPDRLYAPLLRPSRGRRWLAFGGVLAVFLLWQLGLQLGSVESAEGRGAALWTIRGWFGLNPPPDPAANSAFGLVAAPPPDASAAEQLKHYRAEVERQPASPHAWQRLAVAAEAAGENAEARRAFVRVIQLQPRVQESWLALAMHHARQRDWAETEKAARRAASTEGSGRMTAFILLAGAVAVTESPAAAPDVTRLAADAAGDRTLCVPLARVMTTLGHADVSVPMLELALLQKMPGSAAALAEAYDQAGRPEDAARVRSSIKRYGQGV